MEDGTGPHKAMARALREKEIREDPKGQRGRTKDGEGGRGLGRGKQWNGESGEGEKRIVGRRAYC